MTRVVYSEFYQPFYNRLDKSCFKKLCNFNEYADIVLEARFEEYLHSTMEDATKYNVQHGVPNPVVSREKVFKVFPDFKKDFMADPPIRVTNGDLDVFQTEYSAKIRSRML